MRQHFTQRGVGGWERSDSCSHVRRVWADSRTGNAGLCILLPVERKSVFQNL